MRIAIACHPSQGGSGIVATELALALAGRGHDVHLISCDRPFRLGDDAPVRYHRVEVPDYPLFKYPPHDLSLVNKLVEVTRAHDIEIIHAHYAVPHAISAILALSVVAPHPVRVVTTLHGTDITLVGSHPGFFDLCRYSMLRSDGLTAVSRWLSEETVRTFDMPRVPDVIHNFVDTSRFHPEGRVPYPDGGVFRLAHVSNFRPVKRTADIVRVFYEVQKRVPARLTLAGKGPDLGLAQELCAELDICDKVDFAGSSYDIQEVYRGSHIFLLLSDYESFGLSALEALACGTPAVASRAGGLTEVVEDGETGLLCAVGRIDETAEAVVSLLTDRDRWETMSRRAARSARLRFSGDEIVPHYEAYYEALLDTPKEAP